MMFSRRFAEIYRCLAFRGRSEEAALVINLAMWCAFIIRSEALIEDLLHPRAEDEIA